MPAAYRLAANAPRFAATAIFLNPYVRTGAAIASWLAAAYLVWDEANKVWKTTQTSYPVSNGYEYSGDGKVWTSDLDALCKQLRADYYTHSERPHTCRYGVPNDQAPYGYTGAIPQSRGAANCPVGWYITPAGCLQNAPARTVTQPEFEDALAPTPMPTRVPLELPQPTPLPIEYPSPYINPQPSEDPAHRPRFVPIGDPVKNPNYDPNAEPSPANQPYIQPGVRIVPSPTAEQPWRVDYHPVDRPTASSEPSESVDEDTESDTDMPKDEDKQSLCDKYPDIIACQKLEMPEKSNLEAKEFDFNFTPDYGFSGAASCPSPIAASIFGHQLSFSWQGLCNSLSLIKPLLLAMAWLSAAFILLGRSES
ncbi:MAG: virulence factor TspB C-terminal domain-related protein [Acidovorax sp.]|uniref:virulence factor TspB C-terminal domain-related protein n=1 Tax=Acidovorax sp. TaxID=1872122 RepID=UPI0039E29CC8